MKRTKFLTISLLPIMWALYVLFELVTGRITDFKTVIFNIIIILFFAFIGLFIYNQSLKYKEGFTLKTLVGLFFTFFIIDQGIKIIIKIFFFHKYVTLIDNMLYFSPIINTDGSWLNARFGTSVSFPLLITINIIALFLFIEIYRYYVYNGNKDFWADMCLISVFSGALCSLIDKVFYGGSLDFIGISNLFVADIKDIYINLGILFFIVTLFTNGYLSSEEETTLKDDLESLKKFFQFIKKDMLNIF